MTRSGPPTPTLEISKKDRVGLTGQLEARGRDAQSDPVGVLHRYGSLVRPVNSRNSGTRTYRQLAIHPSARLCRPGEPLFLCFRPVAGGHSGDGGLVLDGQRLQHAQRAQPPDVLGEHVVSSRRPVFGCVDPNDVVVVRVLQPRPCRVPERAVVLDQRFQAADS